MLTRASRLSAFIDGFVPPSLAASHDEGPRARLALRIAWLMVVVFGALAVTHALAGSAREALINVALGAIVAVGPFLLRRTGRLAWVLNLELALIFVAVVALSVTARGAGVTAATVALAEIPLFATLIGGVRIGSAWAALSLAAGAVIGLLGQQRVIVDRAPPGRHLFDEHASLAIITATLFFVAVLYERRKQESLRTIAALEVERRRAESERIRASADAEVARAERLASLGRIAAAAAHEINNPLSFVAGGLEYASGNLPPDAPADVRDALREASEGVSRIRRIVDDLRASTLPVSEHASVDAARAARTALKMAEGHTRSRARVRVDIPPVPRVVGQESRLVQVFLNLIVNAAEAIPEGSAAEHEIAIAAREEGGAVVFEVRDTGAGIPAEILPRVKEPFFTTKPIGEGAGLGLSLCENIVKSFGGAVDLESRPGATVARVTLRVSPDQSIAAAPLVAEAEAHAAAATPSDAPSANLSSGVKVRRGLRILVVDDEPLVARSLARLLSPHEVTIAGSGREGLRHIREATFDMIFCDLMMPDLSGMDVYAELRGSAPSLADAMIFMTGGAFTDRAATFRATIKNPFINKPIDMSVVRRLMADRVAAVASGGP